MCMGGGGCWEWGEGPGEMAEEPETRAGEQPIWAEMGHEAAEGWGLV